MCWVGFMIAIASKKIEKIYFLKIVHIKHALFKFCLKKMKMRNHKFSFMKSCTA